VRTAGRRCEVAIDAHVGHGLEFRLQFGPEGFGRLELLFLGREAPLERLVSEPLCEERQALVLLVEELAGVPLDLAGLREEVDARVTELRLLEP
jgi:hypothetical protein